MATHKCRVIGCDGNVTFSEVNRDRPTQNDMSRNFSIVVIDEKPAQCSKCGTSYYEREFTS
jgi:hypothetical protein